MLCFVGFIYFAYSVDPNIVNIDDRQTRYYDNLPLHTRREFTAISSPDGLRRGYITRNQYYSMDGCDDQSEMLKRSSKRRLLKDKMSVLMREAEEIMVRCLYLC